MVTDHVYISWLFVPPVDSFIKLNFLDNSLIYYHSIPRLHAGITFIILPTREVELKLKILDSKLELSAIRRQLFCKPRRFDLEKFTRIYID